MPHKAYKGSDILVNLFMKGKGNDMNTDLKMFFTVRDGFGDPIGDKQYPTFDVAADVFKEYCAKFGQEADDAWIGVVFNGVDRPYKCALVQHHMTPMGNRYISMENNISEKALAIPEIKLAALKASQLQYPFDERTQMRIDALEKQLGVYERAVSTVGDLYIGRWRVHIVPHGGRYGFENHLVNKHRESMVEFWDMSSKNGSFPDGQFVTRYDVESLYDTKWGAGADALMRGGLCLYADVPAWSVSGAEMTQVFEWLKGRELLPGENFLFVSGEADVPLDVVDYVPLPHVDRGALASEAVLTQRLNGLAFVRDLRVEKMGEYKNGTGYTFSFVTQAEQSQVEKDLARALEDLPHRVDIELKTVAVKKEPLDQVITDCAAQVKNAPNVNEQGLEK